MHIFWFLFMVSSFMTIMVNNVKIVVDKDYVRRMTPQEATILLIGHVIAYVVFYFSLTNFIGHMVARF